MFYNIYHTLTTPICIELGWLILGFVIYRIYKAQIPRRRR